MRYRSRPITIDAKQWTGTNTKGVRAWVDDLMVGEALGHFFVTRSMTASTGNQSWRYIAEGKDWGTEIEGAIYDYLHETWVGVKKGQWIIRGTKGEFYPCDPDVFAEKYEEE